MPVYDQYIDNSYFIATAATFSSYKDLIVKVRGLLSGWDSYGYFVCHVESTGSTTNFVLQGSPYDSQTSITGSYYEAKGYGLDEETEYYVSVYFYPYDGGSSSRVRIPANSVSSGVYTVTIPSGGGGGGTDPYFTATGSNVNSSITVQINDLQDTDYDSLYYIITSGSYQDSYQGSSNSHTFSSLADGTYTVRAYYIYNNIDYPIYTSLGSSYIDITIDSGGGGGGGDWSYDDSISPITISSATTPYVSNSFNFNAQNGYLLTFYLDQNGTVEIYSSNTFGGPLISYIGPVNNGYDSDTGIPYSYNNSDTGAFDYTFNAVVGGVYYLWVTSENNSIFKININFTSSSVPSYTASVVNTNQISFSVSNRGNYYLRYFVRLTSDSSNTTYDTWDTYGYLVTNTTLTVSNLSYNTSYTVNVGYSSSSSSAAVTWIGSQILQTGSTGFTYTQVSGVTVSSSQVSKYISFSADNGWIVPIIITQNGILRIYTETTQSTEQDDYGYLTNTLNVNYDSDGVLSSYLIRDDDSHGNREFQINYPSSGYLSAGTYYIWIRGFQKRAITTYLYVSLTPEASSDGYVYIYTGSQWKKAKPYIYDGSSWRPASAYVYNGSTWKITKE